MMSLPPWAVLAMLAPVLAVAAAGASWVLVRSEAGGIVRNVAEMLSVLGHTVRWRESTGEPALDTVPAPGMLAWGLRLPHRMLGCAGCTSWWVGVAGVGVGACALRVDVGSALLVAMLVAPAAAGLGALLDAAWLAMVLHAEWVRVRTAEVADWRGAAPDAEPPEHSEIEQAMMAVAQAAPVARGVDTSVSPPPSASPDLDAPDDGAPLPPVPAPRARALHPSMPVPRPPVNDGSSA